MLISTVPSPLGSRSLHLWFTKHGPPHPHHPSQPQSPPPPLQGADPSGLHSPRGSARAERPQEGAGPAVGPPRVGLGVRAPTYDGRETPVSGGREGEGREGSMRLKGALMQPAVASERGGAGL